MNELGRVVCKTCPRQCSLASGEIGFCRARRVVGSEVACSNYGRITSLALDPIEKKPLAFFHPGSNILSIGSYGCNMRCPFCQNDSISQCGETDIAWRNFSPVEIADIAKSLVSSHRNIGLAYTYNEPLVGWEYVRDCARETKKRDLANVLVSNGCASENVIRAIAPLIDAANIDLKGASQEYYNWLGGDFESVCRTIKILHEFGCHVEITNLIVPGRNDKDEEIEAVADFLISVSDDIPLHITRFFPCWRMKNEQPTPIVDVYRLAEIARRRLKRVMVGNV